MSKVELKQVQKKYGQKKIIHSADLAIETGEFIVIVGPSGCGKSTLLRMIAGLEEITAGEIVINHKVINDLPPKERDIAMVFQNYALYPHMSVYKNMAYGLKMRGMNKKEIHLRVHETAKILHIEEYLNSKPHELSGGQRQRVAMGRAMVRRPALYLFDEPLSNLDAKLRTYMRLEIKRLHQQLKITSIYVTHDQMEAMTLADRLVVINQGKIEQIGTPIDIYREPASVFVAGFIGSPAMNFLEALVADKGKALLIDDQTKIPLYFPVEEKYHHQKVVLGIRPENIEEALNPAETLIKLKLDVVDALGPDTLIHGFINGPFALTARLSGKWQANNRTEIPLKFKSGSLHLFDAINGKRISGDQEISQQLDLLNEN